MCADIFAGTEIPRWMQEVRKENSSLGESLGTILAGGFLAMQQDPNTIDPQTGQTKTGPDGTPLSFMQTRKGFQQGLAEARMNQNDPNWRVKEKLLEGQAMSSWARAATEWQSLDMTNRDMAQWTTQDLPALTKFQEELKTNPDAVAPVMISQHGQGALQQIETSRLRRATLGLQKERADNMSAGAKIAVANSKKFMDSLATVVDPAEQASIMAMMKNGEPTPEAWQALALADKEDPKLKAIEARGEQARKTEEVRGKNRLAVEQVRADNKEDLAKLTFEQKQEFEEQRQADRAALENLKQAGRVDIQKMKDLSRTDATGKTLSRKEFINRHLNTFFTMLRKNAPDDESPSVTADKVEKLLSGLYYRVDKSEAAKASAAAPAPAKTESPATSGTDVSFDDFQKWKQSK